VIEKRITAKKKKEKKKKAGGWQNTSPDFCKARRLQ